MNARQLPIVLLVALIVPSPSAAQEAPPADESGRQRKPTLTGTLTPGARGLARAGTDRPSSWLLRVPSRGRYVVDLVGGSWVAPTLVASPPCKPISTTEGEGGRLTVTFETTRKGTCVLDVSAAVAEPASYQLALRCAGKCARGRVACGPGGHWPPSSLAAFRGDLQGWRDKPVSLSGRPRLGTTTCTARACPVGQGCNACTAPLAFPGRSRTLPDGTVDPGTVRLDGLECTGTETTLASNCPFRPGRHLEAWGIGRGDLESQVLEVWGACSTE